METICDPCSKKTKRLVAEKYWFILEDGGILDPTDGKSIT
jgi:hypothetical protein